MGGLLNSGLLHVHLELLALTFDEIANDELSPATRFNFPVDGDLTRLDEQFGLPAGGDDAGQFQKVIQADLWRFFRHVRILAASFPMSSLHAMNLSDWKVRYDFQYDVATGRFLPQASGPAGWESLSEAERSQHIVEVDLSDADVTDSDFSCLHSARNLRVVNLARSTATDETLKEVAKLTPLRRLFLSDTAITDTGFTSLLTLTNLERITLSRTAIGDAACVALAMFSNLESVTACGTEITDAGVRELRKLNPVKVLWLDDTKVTNACLADIAQITNLTRLHLNRTGVTDEGLSSLESLRNLQRLHVNGTSVTEPAATRLEKKIAGLTVYR